MDEEPIENRQLLTTLHFITAENTVVPSLTQEVAPLLKHGEYVKNFYKKVIYYVVKNF